MKINFVKAITTAGFFALAANVHAAYDAFNAGIQATTASQPQYEQSRDTGKHGHNAGYRLAGGTGVGNPGTTKEIVKPAPQGPVRDPRHQNQVDRLRS